MSARKWINKNSANFLFPSSPTLKWIEAEKYPEKIKNLVIIEGNKALNLINVPVLNKVAPICQIESLNISIYELPDTTVIVSEEKDLNYFASATVLLEKWITAAENITGISFQSKTEYKGKKTSEVCFFRGINSKSPEIPALEAPNFITGLVAGICSFRKFKKSQFSSYVFYTETFDVITIRKLLEFLKRLGLSYNEKAEIRSLNQQSNLYC